MTTRTLNQGQQEAADAFFGFLFTDDKEFIISGPAGVGKTFWMGYVIDTIMPRYYEMCKLMGEDPRYDSVTMTATTNKAAEVLEASTGRPTSTIHSFLSLIITEDFSTGQMKLKPNPRTWDVHHNKIIFIDECSMIDSDLLKYIHEGTHNCKIVYVGDHNQLAPVMEAVSPIYKRGIKIYELTEPMRNAGQPALMGICNQLRSTVDTGIFNAIHEFPGVIDVLDDHGLEQELIKAFTHQTSATRVLAYSNRRVNQFNGHIREHIRHLPNQIQPGEILLNNTPIKLGRRSISAESEITVIANYGAKKVVIDALEDVELDVDMLTIQSHLGEVFSEVPYPTNRDHFDQLVKYYKRQKNWTKYFHLKGGYPDLRPRDAATVHKAQGSTYDTVFVDLANISTCNQADQVARMLYVAFSRARQRVFLYGELAPKYGGVVRF